MPTLTLAPALPHWPFYTGVAVGKDLPYRYQVSIGGHEYIIDPAQYARETIDRLRPFSSDQTAEPGEQSLSTHGTWRRHGRRWDHGAGQINWDVHGDSDRYRYRSSKGLDVFGTQGQLSLLPDTQKIVATTSTSMGVMSVGSKFYYYVDSALKWTADPTVAAPSFTDSGITHVVSSITTDGNFVYVAHSANGIYKTAVGSGSASVLSAQNATLVGYANGVLLAANANVLYSIDAAGVATTLYTHLNPNVTFIAIVSAPTGIYVALNNGDHGEFLFIRFNAATGALTTPVSAGELPFGESIYAMRYYGGMLVLGTSLGLRLGEIVANDGIAPAPLVPLGAACRALALRAQFAFFGLTAYDTVSTGIGRADLSTFTGGEVVPAYASDLMCLGAGTVLSICDFNNARYYAVSGSGIWGQHPTQKVASGVMLNGVTNYGTSEPKVTVSLDMRHAPLAGTVDAAVLLSDGTVLTVGSSSTASSIGPSTPFSIPTVTQEYYEVRITLNRSTDVTVGPLFNRWTMRVIPSPTRVDQFTVPIILRSNVKSPSGEVVQFDCAAEYGYLKSKESLGAPVRYQEGTASYTVVIEKILMPADEARKWTDDRSFLEGIVMVQMISINPIVGE